jgi:RecJ-like exonuclease
MHNLVQEAARLIHMHRNDSVTIISHMDADGVSSAGIISLALNRLNIEHHVKFVHMLYLDVVDRLSPDDLTIFTDLGSSQLQNVHQKFAGHDVIIVDHHGPQEVKGWPGLVHLNAHLLGLDGAQEISGAGMAYLVAQELDPANRDLSALAIVGAVGDIQNAWGKLRGYNRRIAQEGMDADVLGCKTDLLLYGRHSRPIFRALKSFTDPPIPGVSGSTDGCITLLKDLDIPYKSERGWRRPIDLTHEEKQRLASELIKRAIAHVPEELVGYVPGLIIGEVHTLLQESEWSMLRDADEFATCINATARHEQPLIGLEVCRGDRGVYYRAMLRLLKYHRRCIAEGVGFIDQVGLSRTPKGYVQYFDATGELKETFVGTIANLALGHPACDPYKPIVGIVRESGVAKVSGRCSKLLFLKGLDLAKAIREAARVAGGEGGGHAVACGAQVPEEKIPNFLEEFETQVALGLG